MKIQTSRLVGDIKTGNAENEEYFETILRELEDFMVKHKIDKIDIGWTMPKGNQQ